MRKLVNFAAIVPEIVQKGDLDTLVLQTGSIEITNLEVNKAMMDTTKDISEYKKEWFAKAEKDSENLYMIAEEAIAKNANLNVVIVKRLSRFDRPSSDILGVKTQLSKFANHVYDQLWLKNGSPERIYIVQLDLGCDKYSNLKTIIIGNHEHPKYDGIHLVGNAAVRHFTYRAVQAILPIVTKPYSSHQSPKTKFRAHNNGRAPLASTGQDNYHTNCEQARYQRQLTSSSGGEQNSEQTTRTEGTGFQNYEEYGYSVPTTNFFNPLNC